MYKQASVCSLALISNLQKFQSALLETERRHSPFLRPERPPRPRRLTRTRGSAIWQLGTGSAMPSKSAPSLPLWKRRHSSTILHHSARYLLGCKGGWGCKVAPGRRTMHTTLDSCSTPTRVAPRANKPLLPNWNAMPLLSSHVPVACPAYPAARAWHACPAPLVRQVHRLHALQCSPCRLPTSRAQEEREGVCTAPTSQLQIAPAQDLLGLLRLKTSSLFTAPPAATRSMARASIVMSSESSFVQRDDAHSASTATFGCYGTTSPEQTSW